MPPIAASPQYAVLDLATANVITRDSAKLASLATTVDKLNGDLEKMRSAMHEVNGKMQLFVIAEQACGKALLEVKDELKEQRSEEREYRKVQQELHEKQTRAIEGLTATKERLLGMWLAVGKLGMVLVAAAGFIGWLLTNHLTIGVK